MKQVFSPGLHLKIPFWQKARLFNTQTLEYTIRTGFQSPDSNILGDKPVEVLTSNKTILEIDGTILMRLDAKQIPSIWQNIGEDFVPKIIRPTIRSRVRLVASKHAHDEFFSPQRDKIEQEMKEEMEKILYPRGIYIENVLLSEIRIKKTAGKKKPFEDEE